MALDFEPPKLAAVLAPTPTRVSWRSASGELVINLPTVAQAELTYALGSVSGRDVDKFATYGVRTAPASLVPRR